jgi:L-lactate dehydrogenase
MKPRRAVIIGAGRVGGLGGYALASQDLVGELVFIDYNPKMAQAQAHDVADSIPYFRSSTRIWAGDYNDVNDADIVIITAGRLPDRSKGETRNDALRPTINIMKSIAEQIRNTKFDGIIINVSNPADVSAQYIQHVLNYPKNKIFSTSTTLDSARLRRILAEKLGVAPQSIQGYVLGEHGESQMIAWSQITVGGKNFLDYLKEHPDAAKKIDFETFAADVRAMAWTIIDVKGATEYGIGTTIAEVVRAIVNDENKIFPISSLLDGPYGQKGVFAGVPTIVGANGAGQVIEIPLTKEEQAAFNASCKVIKDNYELALTL